LTLKDNLQLADVKLICERRLHIGAPIRKLVRLEGDQAMASRLSEFSVQKLFGLYNHVIPLNKDERITAIIGPNGAGKTVCLRMIEAIFKKNYNLYAEIPFAEAGYKFTSGEIFTVKRIKSDRSENLNMIAGPGRSRYSQSGNESGFVLDFHFSSVDGKIHEWQSTIFDPSNRSVSQISRHLPFLTRAGLNLWIDERDGEEMSLAEISRRYRNRLPPNILEVVTREEPEKFTRLTEQIQCQLIETQRLLVSTPEPDEEPPPYVRYRRARSETNLAIGQKAAKLKTLLRNTLEDYATFSQSLDRSFPRRVLESQEKNSLNEEQLRKKLEDLDARRQALTDAGVLTSEFEAVAVPGTSIEPAIAKVLEVYAQDAVRKLDKFNDLLERISVFREMLESRFTGKKLQIDRESGFKILARDGHEIPLAKLSSGEQHQLILLYELIFEIKKDALILIDEPELSLHVTWQKTFVSSLKRIIQLTPFDVVLATHSPSLVSRHMSLAVALGEVDEERTQQ
jgi:ABC-type lipoprotein export system ATPase subunit